ncbi:hypothetical protein ccbrp13_35050 [Ktedonobacteria bacterium brp13]|nr:hypothetical protein ccbrp13_35050 [Ktedonobacteria bacterium brp13]
MSSTLTTTSTMQRDQAGAHLKPRFFGIVNGEIFKVLHMWSFWITLVLLLCFNGGPYLVEMISSTYLKTSLINTPAHYYYNQLTTSLGILRAFIGFFLIILTATIIGREYQLGTIRILLARGVGRIQLLLAKLTAVVTIAIVVLIVCLVIHALGQMLLQLVMFGNLDKFNQIPAGFAQNTWSYIVTILVSMGATILMTTAITVLGRSMSFGLSAGLAFFPADNIGALLMALGYRITHNTAWHNITTYFLGPNLNAMAANILPANLQLESLGEAPLAPVTGTHTLWVAAVYSVIFAVVAVVLTWKRDVKE